MILIIPNIDFLFDLRGDNQALLKKSNEIIWQGKDMNLTNLKAFLEKHNKLAKYRKEVEKSIKKSNLLEWLSEQDDLKKDFEKTFGIARTREELITWIESEQKEEELTKRVTEKWEMVEQEIRTQRKSKY